MNFRTTAAMVAFEEAARRQREPREVTADRKFTPAVADDVASVDFQVNDSDADLPRVGPVGSLVEHLKEQLSTASRTITRQVIVTRTISLHLHIIL